MYSVSCILHILLGSIVSKDVHMFNICNIVLCVILYCFLQRLPLHGREGGGEVMSVRRGKGVGVGSIVIKDVHMFNIYVIPGMQYSSVILYCFYICFDT